MGVLRDRLFWIPSIFGILRDPYSSYSPFVESLGIPVFLIIPLYPILGSLRPLSNQVLGGLRAKTERGGGSGTVWFLAGVSVELVAMASVMFL